MDATLAEGENTNLIRQEGAHHEWWKNLWKEQISGVSEYIKYVEVEQGCWRISISWVDANITDDPDIAVEPQSLWLMAESFTLDERMSKSVSMVEFLSQLTADQVTLMSERYTTEEVVQTIQNAMSGNVYTLDAIRSSLDNAIWNMELGINASDRGGWSGDDALHLWAGLNENEGLIRTCGKRP